MSVFKIQYQDKKKVMIPVNDRETYLRERTSEEQQRITQAARCGETFTNQKGETLSMKTRLLQYNYSCLPNPDGTLAKSKRLSNTVAMDIDYPGETCGKPLPKWKDEVLKKLIAKKEEVGALLLSDSATKGFHLVFRRHADLTQEENLRWASQVLEVPFDGCAKDHTRVLYEPSEEIYLLDDELFRQEEMSPPQPVTPLQCDSAKSSAQKENLTYRGFSFQEITDKYWELFNDGKKPEEGDRNVKTYELAMILRPICGYSLEKLSAVVPQYDGFPKEEYLQTLQNALKEPRKGMPYRLNQVLQALKSERGVKAAGGTLKTPPPMPKKLPPLIKLLTRNVPWYYKPAVASAVFPALSTHLHGVKFRYWDNVEHEATFMNLLIGRQSIGKGNIKSPLDRILKSIEERDKPSRLREAEYKRNNPSGRSKKDPRPTDICIQLLTDNLTDAAFNQRIIDADMNGKRYIYTRVDEVEGLKKVTSKGTIDEVLLLIRKAFDNGLHGQERVGADSVTGLAPLRWAINASTTPSNARRFFHKGVSDGTVSRLDISTVIYDDETAEDPIMGIYDEAFQEELNPYLQRLENASGLIECPAANRLSLRMKQENKDTARLYESEAYKVYSYRANLISWLKGMVLYIADGYRWAKEIADFVRWTQRYDLWCKMLYFGKQLEQELREELDIQKQGGPQNLLDLLNDDFTLEEYAQMRQQQGKSGDGEATLRQWKCRGNIEWDEIMECYHKTEAYLNRSRNYE